MGAGPVSGKSFLLLLKGSWRVSLADKVRCVASGLQAKDGCLSRCRAGDSEDTLGGRWLRVGAEQPMLCCQSATTTGGF